MENIWKIFSFKNKLLYFKIDRYFLGQKTADETLENLISRRSKNSMDNHRKGAKIFDIILLDFM